MKPHEETHGMLMGWADGDVILGIEFICVDCDDHFEHETWQPIYQGSVPDDAICRECGGEL